MREEYNNVLSTPSAAGEIGRFGRYQYIGKTQISADYIGQADISVYLYLLLQQANNRLCLKPDKKY